MRPKTHRLALSVLAFAGFTAAALANAQTSANGPYYATPAWDQKLQCDTKATCPRFIVLANWNNDAVLDRETGLVWEKAATHGVFSNWLGALERCATLELGGRSGWRLPARTELMSLVDRSALNTALPPGHPFTVQSASLSFWTATTYAGFGTDAWMVEFAHGLATAENKSVAAHAWCVRGGAGVDPQ